MSGAVQPRGRATSKRSSLLPGAKKPQLNLSPMTAMAAHDFDAYFRDWVEVACEAWQYPHPGDDYYERVSRRLPEGLRALVTVGVREGLIIPQGFMFTLLGHPGKGPYTWFSHQRFPRKEPAPNWEYFVQVAEFVRLSHIAAVREDLAVTFEDQLMDIGVYRAGRLVVYCEVKVVPSQLQRLVKELRVFERGIDVKRPDRHEDPLRKAKYLLRYRPDYLALAAIGARFEYRVRYSEGGTFALIPDVIPFV